MRSKLVILSFVFISVFVLFNTDKQKVNQFQGDKCGYYLFLPAIFTYHDIKQMSFYPILDAEYDHSFTYPLHNINGNKIDKYGIGVAIFEAPLFFIATFYCHTTHQFKEDGFSTPYQLAGLFSNIFFVIAGLFILRRFLKRYFSDVVTAMTLFCIAYGTNLYAYTAFEGEMSHTYSFFLFSCLISLSDTWYAKPPQKHISILCGLVIGLIFLVRPFNIIALIIPLLWKVHDGASLKERINYWKKYFSHIIIIILFSALLMFTQFCYWKYISGHWLTDTYPNEVFNFLHPNIINGLFSYRKGWFVYTPMALAGIAGFYFLWKKDKKTVPVLALFFVVMIYCVFSWRDWWYGWGFSCRPLVEALAFLSLPLAAINRYFLDTAAKIKKIPYFTLILFFVALNIFQTYQYSLCILDGANMTEKRYWEIFGKYNY